MCVCCDRKCICVHVCTGMHVHVGQSYQAAQSLSHGAERPECGSKLGPSAPFALVSSTSLSWASGGDDAQAPGSAPAGNDHGAPVLQTLAGGPWYTVLPNFPTVMPWEVCIFNFTFISVPPS